jgi:hypothetical protein
LITLEFTKSKTLGARLIQSWTWCPYVHVQFVLGNKRLAAFPGKGVLIQPPSPDDETLQLEVDAPRHVVDVAMTQIGKPYDWTAILGIVAHRDWREDDSWICSELVAWAFETAGSPLLNAKHLNRITPRDLLLSPMLRPSDSMTVVDSRA